MQIRKKHYGASLALSFLVPALVLALWVTTPMAQDTPLSIEGAKTVSADEVKSLLAQGAKVFDLRKKASYVEKHIAGAVAIIYDEKSAKAASFKAADDTFDLSQLPADKNAKLIFHGHGTDGWKGYKAAAAAVKAGYKNVYFFRGGFAEWIAKGFPTV